MRTVSRNAVIGTYTYNNGQVARHNHPLHIDRCQGYVLAGQPGIEPVLITDTVSETGRTIGCVLRPWCGWVAVQLQAARLGGGDGDSDSIITVSVYDETNTIISTQYTFTWDVITQTLTSPNKYDWVSVGWVGTGMAGPGSGDDDTGALQILAPSNEYKKVTIRATATSNAFYLNAMRILQFASGQPIA